MNFINRFSSSQVFLFFGLLFLSVSGVKGQESELLTQALDEFQHARTWYWYGRALDNSLYEFSQARKYLDASLELLEGLSLIEDTIDQSSEKSNEELDEFMQELEEFGETLDAMDQICIENLNGRFPLSMDLLGRMRFYEFWDDANEVALENSLKNILEMPFPVSPLNEQMMYAILYFTESNEVLEEVAMQYLAANSRFYMLGSFNLMDFLGEEEMEEYMEEGPDREVVDLVCKELGIDELGVFRMNKEDEVDGIFRWSADFSLYDQSKLEDEDLFVEGYSHDKTGVRKQAVTHLLILVFCILLVFSLYVLFVSLSKKEENTNGILFTVLKASGFYGGFMLISMIEIGILMILLRSIAPGSTEFYLSLKVRLIWFGLVPLVITMVPLIINFILASRFLGQSVHREENLTGLIGGSLTAQLVFLSFHSLVKTGDFSGVGEFAYVLVVLFVLSLIVSGLYRRYMVKRNNWVLWGLILMIPTALMVSYHSMLNLEFLSLGWPRRISNMIPAFAGVGLLLVSELKSKISADKKPKIEKREKGEIKDLKELKLFFEEPVEYVPLGIYDGSEKFQEQLMSILFRESDRLRIPLFHAPRGAGKTRIIKELQDYYEEKEGIMIFYGDCNEFQDADMIPYEPFVEALSEYLGVGAFTNPSKKMLGVLDALKDGEFGPVSSLAGLIGGSGEQSDGADVVVVARDVLSRFQRIQNLGKKILLIIEDIQWMDENTERLLLKVFSQLCTQSDLHPNLRVLLTLRADDNQDVESNRVINKLRKLGSGLLEIDDLVKSGNLNFAYPNYFEDLMNANGIVLNFYTMRRMKQYFDSNKYKIPLHFNQIMVNMIDKGWIQLDHNEFKLSSGAKLDDLLPPNELSKIYREKFQLLDQDMLRLLIAAAYIGKTFEARILASVWWGVEQAENRMLELLLSLQDAEKLGLLRDVSDEDDVYEFSSRGIMAELRAYDMIKPEQSRKKDVVSEQIILPQAVKEYHKRIIKAIETYKNKELEIDLDILVSVAMRSRYLDAKNELNLEKILKYNLEAGERCNKAGRVKEAIDYYKYCLELIENPKYRALRTPYHQRRNELVLKLVQAYLDVSENEIALKQLTKSDLKGTGDYATVLNLKALAGYRKKHQFTCEEIKSIYHEFKMIPEKDIPEEQKFRARFTMILACGYDLYSEVKGVDALMILSDELKKLLDQNELRGEVLNSIAWGFLSEGSDRCLEFLDERTGIILNLDDSHFPFKDERRKEIYMNLGDLAELNLHQKVSLKYGLGVYATFFSKQPDKETAHFFLKETIKVNRLLGDQFGVVKYLNLLGKHLLNIGDQECSEAYSSFEEAYWSAKVAGLNWFLFGTVIDIKKANNYGILGKDKQVKRVEDDFKDFIKSLLVFPEEFPLHLIKHFEVLNSECSMVVREKYSSAELDVAMKESGSKFIKDLGSLDDLKKLVSDHRWDVVLCNFRQDKRVEITLRFEKETFAEGIGFDAVFEINKLSRQERERIKLEDIGKYQGQVLTLAERPPTWDLSIILQEDEISYELITVFPGKMAPPLPDKAKQDKMAYTKSKEFWNQHVLWVGE